MFRATLDEVPGDRPNDDAVSGLGGVSTVEGDAPETSAAGEVAEGFALDPPCKRRRKRPRQDVARVRRLRAEHQRLGSSSSQAILPSVEGENTAGHLGLLDIPDEVIEHVFSYLLELDLCRVAKVCRLFHTISSGAKLWKSLFRSVFEYDLPIFHPASNQFHFLSPDEAARSPNAWKESFRQLYGGIHVRPLFQADCRGRSLICTDKIETALTLSRALNQAVIFVHAGTYREESITLDAPVALIGAAPGNVAEKVIIERGTGSTVTIVEGSRAAYLGYLTLKFTPQSSSSRLNREHCCLDVTANCSPRVEHCIVRTTSMLSAAVRVSGRGAEPCVRWCEISDCRCVGLCIADYAEGTYEDNEISRIASDGVWVKNYASPVIRRNRIHHCVGAGVHASHSGMGYFEANHIHDSTACIEVQLDADPKVVRCDIHHGGLSGIHVHNSGRGQFEENKIHSCVVAGSTITTNSNPVIRRNEIHTGPSFGVFVCDQGRGVIENNEIFGDQLTWIHIDQSSSPTVRNNEIHHGELHAQELPGPH